MTSFHLAVMICSAFYEVRNDGQGEIPGLGLKGILGSIQID